LSTFVDTEGVSTFVYKNSMSAYVDTAVMPPYVVCPVLSQNADTDRLALGACQHRSPKRATCSVMCYTT